MTGDEIRSEQFAAGELLLLPEQVLLPEGPVAGHAVVVAEGRFRAVGPGDAVIAAHPGITPIALPGKLVMPGFVDAHHHLSQTFGKALAYGEPSEIFRRLWVPLETVLDNELVYLAAKAAALEALRGGFTTVVDAGTRAVDDTAAVARAAQEAGLRCVLGYICNDLGTPGGADRNAILRRARDHLERWQADALVHPSLAISIPEAASDAMLREVSAMAGQAGAIFQTHVNEHLVAVERSLVQRGLRPLEHLLHAGALGPHALIAHSTLVTPAELITLRDTDTAVAYCPVASQWKGNAVAPALLMSELGIRFGIGTDGTRSDGFRLVDAAEACQRIAFGLAVGDSSTGAGWTWLDHATAGGAAAAGLGRRTGAIEPGKAADFLILDIDIPELTPSWDLRWELVRLGNRDQIVAVFVGGKLRLWRGWPIDWDGRALLSDVRARAAAAVAKAPIQRVHPLSGEHRARAMTRRPR
jgi:cytosine/adenosine deaminase-related metal-dependent hydrolase